MLLFCCYFVRATVERFEYIFDQLEQLKVQEMDRLEESNGAGVDFFDDDDEMEMDNDDNATNEGMKKLEKLYKKLEAYCNELVVFGFNSSGYDIKLIKKHLFKELCKHGQQPTFTVKKSGKYLCIKTGHLKFLDVLQFLAPGYNLKSFFKAFGVTKQKVSFLMIILPMLINQMKPLCRHMKLFSRTSRTATSWKNTLCFKNMSIKRKSEQEALQILRFTSKPKTGPENFKWFQQLRTENQLSTFADFLKWCNDLDVTPMIQAIENMNEFYKQKHIDFMRQAISLPGVAMRVCFNRPISSSIKDMSR